MSGDPDCDLIQTSNMIAPFVVLIDTNAYAYNPAHRFYSDLSGIISVPEQLLRTTVHNGVFNALNVTIPGVASSIQVKGLAIYRRNTGPSTTWRLVCYMDTGIVGIPVLPDGGVTIVWNDAGIFAL